MWGLLLYLLTISLGQPTLVCEPKSANFSRVRDIVPLLTHAHVTEIVTPPLFSSVWAVEYATAKRTLLLTENIDHIQKSNTGRFSLLYVPNATTSPTSARLLLSPALGPPAFFADAARYNSPSAALFSPDDQYVLFAGLNGVYTKMIGGGIAIRVSTSAFVFGSEVTKMSISPSGRYIAYMVEESSLFVAEAGVVGGASMVAFNVTFDQQLAWSPDDSLLTFCFKVLRSDPLAVYTARAADGGGLVALSLPTISTYSAQFSPDGSRVVFGGLSGGSTNFRDFIYGAVPGQANSTVLLSNPEATALLSGWTVGAPATVFYGAKFPLSGVESLWRVDARQPESTRQQLSPANASESVSQFRELSPILVVYIWTAADSGSSEVYLQHLSDPLPARELIPVPGSLVEALSFIDENRLFIRSSTESVLATAFPNEPVLVESFSNVGDQVVNVVLQTNKVSLMYRTPLDVYVSCIRAPKLVNNGTQMVSGTLAGHLVVGTGAVLEVSSAVSIMGTAVLAGALQIDNHCQLTEVVPIYNSTWTEGSFSSVNVMCPEGCSAETMMQQTTSSLSVVVTVSCDSSLSTGALIGIIIGALAGGVLVALGLVLITKVAISSWTARQNSAIGERNQVNLKRYGATEANK